MSSQSIKQLLASLDVSNDDLRYCDDLNDEFNIIKKAFHRRALQTHPDKGGDPAEFRKIQTAFEILREKFSNSSLPSFVTSDEDNDISADEYNTAFQGFKDMPTPSWDFYETAASVDVPLYTVDLAKSGRSSCVAKGKAKKCTDPLIEKKSIRIGVLNAETGTYGRFVHLACWRVPSRIWTGISSTNDTTTIESLLKSLLAMEQVLFCGLSVLSVEEQESVLTHVSSKDNWARKVTRKKVKEEDTNPSSSALKSNDKKNSSIVPKTARREKFVMPVPGKSGARAQALAGKTIVLTGTFPEIGGGSGLSLGKARLKSMIQSFGGRVTSAISGKTDLLIVGKAPGFSKVSKARSREKILMLSGKDLKTFITTDNLLESEDPKSTVVITEFSAGFQYYGGATNSTALLASEEELAFARGEVKALTNGKKKEMTETNKKTRSVKALTNGKKKVKTEKKVKAEKKRKIEEEDVENCKPLKKVQKKNVVVALPTRRSKRIQNSLNKL